MEQRTVFLTALVVALVLCSQSALGRTIDDIISSSSNHDNGHLQEIDENNPFLHEMDILLTPEQRRMLFGDDDPRESSHRDEDQSV